MPILEPMDGDASRVTATLPEGSWRYLFDPSEDHGVEGTVTIDVPLAAFPVFVREGSEVATLLVR
jgi:alpha-glucosidase (family GH31 glycosyl hydrolase)